MPVKFNINNVLDLYYAGGGVTNFEPSLKKVLRYLQNDDNVGNIKETAYLLATAKSESDYSLSRWESDYLCGEKGVPYVVQPCQKAIDYYRSTDGKSNYFLKGVDSNGMAYFGRGLIQLTGKSNYEKYGRLAGLGDSLVIDGDLAMKPKNSYKVASAYLKRRTFDYVNSNDLTNARRSVNGGTNGVDRTNEEYFMWIDIFSKPSVKFEASIWTRRNRIAILLLSFFIVTATLFIFVKK